MDVGQITNFTVRTNFENDPEALLSQSHNIDLKLDVYHGVIRTCGGSSHPSKDACGLPGGM